jgi:hypothetical protein
MTIPTTDYGVDVAMNASMTGMDPAMKMVSGRRALAEALVRRLQTPNGRLIDDPDYGYDLLGELNDDVDPSAVGRIGAQAASECQKDERVIACTATASFTLGVLTVGLVVTDSKGPFRLVVAASGATVSLLQVTS